MKRQTTIQHLCLLYHAGALCLFWLPCQGILSAIPPVDYSFCIIWSVNTYPLLCLDDLLYSLSLASLLCMYSYTYSLSLLCLPAVITKWQSLQLHRFLVVNSYSYLCSLVYDSTATSWHERLWKHSSVTSFYICLLIWLLAMSFGIYIARYKIYT